MWTQRHRSNEKLGLSRISLSLLPYFDISKYLLVILMFLDPFLDLTEYGSYIPIKNQTGHTYEHVGPNLIVENKEIKVVPTQHSKTGHLIKG